MNSLMAARCNENRSRDLEAPEWRNVIGQAARAVHQSRFDSPLNMIYGSAGARLRWFYADRVSEYLFYRRPSLTEPAVVVDQAESHVRPPWAN